LIPARQCGVCRVGALEQLAHVWRGRSALQLHRTARLFHASIPHNDNLVRESRRLGQVMGHQQRGEAEFTPDSLEGLVCLTARDGVEGTERLVEQDGLLASREGAGERDALSLSAGQLVRQSMAERRWIEPNAFQRVISDRFWRRVARQSWNKRDIPPNRPVRE
jgi:hypothetical protein